MTIREAMADWLTDGALTKAREREVMWGMRCVSEYTARQDLRDALQDIAAMETPGANATVRRMAARARKAME